MDSSLNRAVTVQPHFRIHSGRMEAAKELLVHLAHKVKSDEPRCLYYNFTICDDEVFCREGYLDADGVFAHMASVGEMIGKLLGMADMIRLEIHGPADELRKLKEPMAAFSPRYFVLDEASA